MTTETVRVPPPNPTITEVLDQRSTSTLVLPTTVTVEKEAGLISGLKPEIIAVIALIAVVGIGAVVILRRRGRPSASEKTKYCGKCGTALQEDDVYCVSCGAITRKN